MYITFSTSRLFDTVMVRLSTCVELETSVLAKTEINPSAKRVSRYRKGCSVFCTTVLELLYDIVFTPIKSLAEPSDIPLGSTVHHILSMN